LWDGGEIPEDVGMIFRLHAVPILAAGGLLAIGLPPAGAAAPTSPESVTPPPTETVVPILDGAMLHFLPDSAAKFALPGQTAEENGRVLRVRAPLPAPAGPGRILARVTVHPVPKDDRTVYDCYDRAGNVRLITPGRPDLEIVRFMTAYGGRTDHEIDVSELAPLLRGERELRAFIDTWSSPGWRVDVSLVYRPDSTYDPPVWAVPVYYTDSMNRQDDDAGVEVPVEVPPGMSRVVLRYLTTGHCTDGRDEDEFVSKANVISVDGEVVARFYPWRDDCRQYRDRNPYCTRWTDGTWSSDYSRSGWCPGTAVVPMEVDLSDHLSPGKHRIRFRVEDIRPRNEAGDFGYWRVSASLVGWDHPPRLWKN
jgi:Peptide-N-glycosidase F, C terminal/Peptide-N-glycosidase F, N terminal